ncbi:hypothetical protein O7606_21590 [Micromonospora sp. WMMD882]|uniref:hypothetical protein n=1 Tax=Micromonospora sp. WMMD882 TaxID=3015151 RepID=UPI00248BD90F|nr:hypothetical protein [Micromonospora sp. WMMD882]WBB78777.1 hypothetical protein O7606_21590 [Micromonospora sp. WMMD882]
MRPEEELEVARDLARPLVARFSPAEEGEIFVVLGEAYLADPVGVTRPGRSPGPLAFGLPDVVVLLTPIALTAMTEVVRYVVEAGLRRGHRATGTLVRRLFRPSGQDPADSTTDAGPEERSSADGPLELTAAEWNEIHRIVERTAVQGGVAPPRAALIADAVVGAGRRKE